MSLAVTVQNTSLTSRSAAKPSGRIFRATWRLGGVCVACQTWPIAAFANEGGDVVVAEAGPGCQCHGSVSPRVGLQSPPHAALAEEGSYVVMPEAGAVWTEP